MKTCKKCGLGFEGDRCIPCRRAYDKMRGVRDAVKMAARKVRWAVANRERLLIKQAQYYIDNKARVYERNRAWLLAHPGKAQEYATRHYVSNSARITARNKAWAASHPEVHRTVKVNRRARERAAVGIIHTAYIKDLMRRQNGSCVYCHTDITARYDIDHIIPIARGGTNEAANVQLLCGTCNKRKSAKHPDIFMEQLRRGLYDTVC